MRLSGIQIPAYTISPLTASFAAAPTQSPAVRNWGYLENWKSTASNC